jgi:hypothetical protein
MEAIETSPESPFFEFRMRHQIYHRHYHAAGLDPADWTLKNELLADSTSQQHEPTAQAVGLAGSCLGGLLPV